MALAEIGADKMGREIFYMVELDLSGCGNIYGQAPCEAGGEPGQECYNTWSTCVDKNNYTRVIKTITFVPDIKNLPLGLVAFPCISSLPTITPAKLEFMKGIGQRGACQIRLTDFAYQDRYIDPYWKTRTQPPAGTLLGRLFSRYRYVKGRAMRLYIGYAVSPFDRDNLSERLYFIEKIDGPNSKGLYTVEGKDILKTLDDDRKTVPAVSYTWLLKNINSGAKKLDLASASEDFPLKPGPDYILINDELIYYTGETWDSETMTGTLTGLTRGVNRTDDATHDSLAAIQQCKAFESVPIAYCLYDLLVNYGGVDPAYIPFSDWQAEAALWLQNNNVIGLLPDPEGVGDVIGDLSEQHGFNIWWDEIRQQIKLKAISPETLNATPPTLNDHENFLEKATTIREDDSIRITQLWIYYGPISYIQGREDPKNFYKLLVAKDPIAEGPNEFGSEKIKVLYCHLLDTTQEGLAQALVERVLVKTSRMTKIVNFSLDAKDITDDLWTGSNMIFHTRESQQPDGQPSFLSCTIVKAKEAIPGTRFDFQAIGFPDLAVAGPRYGFITENDFPDYDNATDNQKTTGFFLSDGDNPFADGGTPYLIS